MDEFDAVQMLSNVTAFNGHVLVLLFHLHSQIHSYATHSQQLLQMTAALGMGFVSFCTFSEIGPLNHLL